MVTFEFCNFDNPDHTQALLDLYDQYMKDPMGNAPALDSEQQQKLIGALKTHPSAFIMFIRMNGKYAGLATCFELLSTFKVQPYLYIHDVIIHSHFRGQRLGRKLLEQITAEARKRNCCKIALEVREDNQAALRLYHHMGFADCHPKLYFWTKNLNP